MRVAFKPKPKPAKDPDLHLYVRFDPTVNGNGGGGRGQRRRRLGARSTTRRATRCSSHPTPSRRRTRRTATTRSRSTPRSTGRSREAESGFVGAASDGLVQLDATHALTPTYPDAEGGNVVQTAQVALDKGGKTELTLGFGATQAEAVGAAEGSLGADFGTLQDSYRKGWKRVRQVAEQAAEEALRPEAEVRRRARRRVLPERERAQGLRGQDLPRRDRGQPRLAVGSGGLGRRSGEHLLRLLSRGLRPRPLRGVDRPLRRRRPRHRARRDAVPVRAPAAAGRVDAAKQPRQRQDRTRLVRDAARRGRLPDPDGAAARAHGSPRSTTTTSSRRRTS